MSGAPPAGPPPARRRGAGARRRRRRYHAAHHAAATAPRPHCLPPHADEDEDDFLSGMNSPPSGYDSGDETTPYANAEILSAVQQEVEALKRAQAQAGAVPPHLQAAAAAAAAAMAGATPEQQLPPLPLPGLLLDSQPSIDYRDGTAGAAHGEVLLLPESSASAALLKSSPSKANLAGSSADLCALAGAGGSLQSLQGVLRHGGSSADLPPAATALTQEDFIRASQALEQPSLSLRIYSDQQQRLRCVITADEQRFAQQQGAELGSPSPPSRSASEAPPTPGSSGQQAPLPGTPSSGSAPSAAQQAAPVPVPSSAGAAQAQAQAHVSLLSSSLKSAAALPPPAPSSSSSNGHVGPDADAAEPSVRRLPSIGQSVPPAAGPAPTAAIAVPAAASGQPTAHGDAAYGSSPPAANGGTPPLYSGGPPSGGSPTLGRDPGRPEGDDSLQRAASLGKAGLELLPSHPAALAALGLQGFSLSLCGSVLRRDATMGPAEVRAAFEEHRLTPEAFSERAAELARSPELMVRVGGVVCAWQAAAPVVMGALAFGGRWEQAPQLAAELWKLPVEEGAGADGVAGAAKEATGARLGVRAWRGCPAGLLLRLLLLPMMLPPGSRLHRSARSHSLAPRAGRGWRLWPFSWASKPSSLGTSPPLPAGVTTPREGSPRVTASASPRLGPQPASAPTPLTLPPPPPAPPSPAPMTSTTPQGAASSRRR